MSSNNNQNISIVNQAPANQATTQSTNNKPNQGNSTPAQSSESKSCTNTIGHYQLGKALGEGTFGKVKLGTHILTEEKVAVKVLEKSRIKDKKDVERISREIKILKQLHHPNVVQIYEIIETEKDLYLVMEFVQGGELFDLIVQNQRLKEKMACKYFQELISGINYIHQLGICHRDLKPENLLIDYDQSLKIVDFGLSNLYEQGTTLKTACGSPCYAAPEMIAGHRYSGLMSDLWSCGVVLYAMLCGYLPYEDQKTSDLYKKILNAEYNLPEFLSEEAKDMISQIFITDPSQRITVEGIRDHPWYQIHKPDTSGFNILPPVVQAQRPDTCVKNGKTYKIIQRPHLQNQKIITNLESSYGFNRESLLKSIKNNKHNHLTATYYLLLKKHMIRQLKPYAEAFIEYKSIDEKDISFTQQSEVHQKRGQNQQPKISLKSKDVQEAIKNKRQEKQSETPVPDVNTNPNDAIQPQEIVQKQFQSIDPNNLIDKNQRGQQNKLDPSQNMTKKQNYMNNDYSDNNVTPNMSNTEANFNQQNHYRNQYNRDQQNSRQSNNSKKSNRDQQNQKAKYGQEYKKDETSQGTFDQELGTDEFTGQTQQSFANKKQQQQQQTVFNMRRREQSANPYINAGSSGNYKQNDNLKQYQHQINQLKQQEQLQQQQLNTQLQKSGRSPRWQTNQGDSTELSERNGSNKSYKNNQNYQNPYPNNQKPRQKLAHKSSDSFRNMQSDENHPNANPQTASLGNKLINPYQVKRRAESYNNKRRGELDNSGSLDKLDKFGIIIDDGNQRRRDDNDDEVEYIRSKNMKETNKGNHREIRAPSSGSSGSQPRVQVAGQNNTGSGQLSMNSSGVQRRYDSIEHQRQSQIDKFLLSPQEQIEQYNNKSKNNNNFTSVTDNKNIQKKIKIINNNGQFSNSDSLNNQAQNIRNFNTNAAHSYNNHNGRPENNINIVNVIKNKQDTQNNQQQKKRNSSKSQNITNANEGSQHNRNVVFTQQQQSAGSGNQGGQGQTQNQVQNSMYYKHLQQQLNLLNQRRQNTNESGVQQLNQQYSSNLKNMQQEQSNQMILQNIQNLTQNNMNNSSYQDIDEDENQGGGTQSQNTVGGSKVGQNPQNYGTLQNSVKQVHRKAKSMLNQNGVGVNVAYQNNNNQSSQNQKVQQVKLSDGSIRNLMHQLAQNKSNVSNNSNGNQNSIQNSNKINIKKEQHLNNHNSTGSNQHNFHVMHGSGNHGPTMPSAPKSGNIIKLKQQVVRTKSSNQRERGNSQGNQPTNGQSSLQQQPLSGNGANKKKTIVHTTKNTMGQGHQHNFDMIDNSNPNMNVNHMFSVQHTQNTSSKDNRNGAGQGSNQSNSQIQDQVTDNSIATSTANKSGATLKSNYSKITQGKQSYTNNSQNEGYLQNLIREYEKNQTNNASGKINQNNASQQQQVQQVIRQINQKQENPNNGNQNPAQVTQGQGSINVTSISNSNKRSKVKVHQKQKTHQIENIQKQISQNQKTMQNMTQNLFSKNNTGQFMPQQNQRGQQQVDMYDEQKAQNLNDSVRGSSRGIASAKMSVNGAPNQNCSQNQNQRRQSNHQNPNNQRGNNHVQNNQQNIRHSSHQKNQSNMQNDPQNYRNHYQTQDNRRGQDAPPHQNATLQNQMHVKQQPSSTTAAMSGSGNGGLQSRHSQQSSNFMPQNDTTNSAMSGGVNNMDEFIGQQMQNKQINEQQQQQQQQHNNQVQSRKPSTGTNQRVNSKGSKNGANQRGHSSGNQNLSIKQNFSANSGHQNGITQMSIMSKYNQQQQQIQLQNQQQREQRNLGAQNLVNGPNGQGGHTRHYSAPREGAYGQPIGIDDDELKRQCLLNQSVDMSQLNNLQAQINKMSGYNKINNNFEELQKLNLSQFGNSVSSIGNNVRSVQNQRNSVEMGQKQYNKAQGSMGQNSQKVSQKIVQNNKMNHQFSSSSQNQAYDNQHQNFTPNQLANRQGYQSNFDFGSTNYNVNSSSAGMTGSVPGMGGMRAEVSGGLNLAQDYSQGHGLDAQMDRSSRGTAATAANTISGNINRSGGNINYRPAVGTGSGSSGDNIMGSQNKYSQPHFQASQAYQQQHIMRMNDTSSGDIGRHGALHNNDI